MPAFSVWLLALGMLAGASQTPAQLADKAEADFAEGKFAETVADYDRLAVLIPSLAPDLWQRGIALYYLGRYDECAAQFKAFHNAERPDAEDAAWHFFCVARGQSIEKARAQLLEAGADPRIMRPQVFEMLRGAVTPSALIDQAEKSYPIAQFYAHVYVALYLEAAGDRVGSLAHMRIAAHERYRSFGGFMNVVAQVHVKAREKDAGRRFTFFVK